MKRITFTSIFFLMLCGFVFAQSIPSDSLYFGQTPPGDSAITFAPGIVSIPNRDVPNITFSPDGKTVFFYVGFYPNPGTPYIMISEYKDNHWNAPVNATFSSGRSTGEPFFAFNGTRLYMFASNAVNHVASIDLSYSEKQGDAWSAPISLGNPPNSEGYQYHPCIVGDTSIYFASSAGYVRRSQYINGVYQEAVNLPSPINYIGSQTWGDPYVSPNEDYMLIKSKRAEGYGLHDIYIAYKRPDGTWTNPKNLGNKINTPNEETTGDITPDGKYMTFTTGKTVRWVSTSFIEKLKYTNYIPYLNKLIPDKKDTAERVFTFTLPDSTFIDDDGNSTLTYSATLSNGNPLPTWLTFNANTKTFTSTATVVGSYNIKVIAKDTANTSTYDIFNLKIAVNPTKINTVEEQDIQLYPNPANEFVNISLGENKCKKIIAEIINLNGKTLQSNAFFNDSSIKLDLKGYPKGIYFIKLILDEKTINKKICIE